MDDEVLNGGQGNSMTTKLEGAKDKLDEGNTEAGINRLRAFINQVNSLRDEGILSHEEAQLLIDAANAAIASALPGSALRTSETARAGHDEALLSVLNDWDFSGAANRASLQLGPSILDIRTWREPSGENGLKSLWAVDDDEEIETDFDEILAEIELDVPVE
jgi:hypothetical protein